MTEKKPDRIFYMEEFPILLKAKMMNDTIAEFAEKLDVSPKLIYMLLAGTRAPSESILRKLGLMTVIAIDPKATPPGKP